MTIGQIAFLGSGETSLAGGRIFESLARRLPRPLHIAILETPAGFELNSGQVAGRVGDFLKARLQNYQPVIDVIPARKKGSVFSPDDPAILRPLLHAHMIFMGPGSPTYAVRHLKDTLAWDLVRARHRLGAALAIASAATISVGAWVLPVYEIYKVGQDVHTMAGLGLFADFGLQLSLIPHWNNAEGGTDLDTSRCFVGMERFAAWCDLLPPENTTLGLDEHTGIIMDFETSECAVSGVSTVSLVRECDPEIYPSGATFDLKELGDFKIPQQLDRGISRQAWEMATSASIAPLPFRGDRRSRERREVGGEVPQPPADVLALVEKRQQARARKDFTQSDRLRDQIAALGWEVQDTNQGQKLARS